MLELTLTSAEERALLTANSKKEAIESGYSSVAALVQVAISNILFYISVH